MNVFTNALRAFAARHGYYIRKMDGLSTLDTILHLRLSQSPHFNFVQIGANDGVLCDAIYPFVTRFRLPGLVVEPLPDVFEQLKKTYRRHPQVTPVNVALHRTARQATIYRADPADTSLPSHTSGIASFDREHLRRFHIPDRSILAVQVPCVTFHELLERYAISHIDLLQIDTEGYDLDILAMVDLERITPAIIRFEHGLPDDFVSWDQLQATLRRLHDHGYFFALDSYDLTAYQPPSWTRVAATAAPKRAP